MTEPSQVDLNRYSFRLVLGRTDSGAIWPLALHESHGIIASGSDAEALRALASAQLESLFHQECVGNAELIWAGQTLPAWAEGRKDVTAVSEPAEIFSRLETFVEEQNRRFDVMHEAGSNNLPHYNAASAAAGRDLLPFRMFFIEHLPGTVSRLGHTFLDKLCYAARYGRACGILPFDVQSFSNEKQGELAPFNSGKKGVKPFWLAQMTTDGFEHTTAMKANKPYIISLPNSESYEDEFNISGEVQFHAEDADGVEVKATSYKELARIEGSNRIMVPAYETVFKHDTVYAINPATYEDIAPGGAFVRNLRDVQPFEAYLISKEAAINAPKLYSIGGIGGEITGIEELPSDAWNGIEIYVRYGVLYIKSDRERTFSIYDTAGHMVRQVEVQEGTTAVTGLGKGIYLLARKKILVQ